MNKTASMVLKIIGASLAFAAVICLLIGGWHDLSVGYSGMKKRLARKFGSEYDDYMMAEDIPPFFIVEITIAYFPEQCKSGMQEF